jgi:hypothetical protein
MMCLNEVALLAVRGISLHVETTLDVIDSDQHLILDVASKCSPLITARTLDLNCIWVEGINE